MKLGRRREADHGTLRLMTAQDATQDPNQDATQDLAQDPEWIVVMAYENLPGCPHPLRSVCD